MSGWRGRLSGSLDTFRSSSKACLVRIPAFVHHRDRIDGAGDGDCLAEVDRFVHRDHGVEDVVGEFAGGPGTPTVSDAAGHVHYTGAPTGNDAGGRDVDPFGIFVEVLECSGSRDLDVAAESARIWYDQGAFGARDLDDADPGQGES